MGVGPCETPLSSMEEYCCSWGQLRYVIPSDSSRAEPSMCHPSPECAGAVVLYPTGFEDVAGVLTENKGR